MEHKRSGHCLIVRWWSLLEAPGFSWSPQLVKMRALLLYSREWQQVGQ